MKIKVEYNIEPKKGENLEEIIDDIRRDISWGTFIPELSAAQISVEGSKYCEIYNPQRFEPTYERSQDGFPVLSFDVDMFNFEREGINHFIGTIAGDILFNNKIANIDVLDITFDEENLKSYFKGPKSGIKVLKEEILAPTLKGENRPIVAFSIKPRLGLSIKQYRQIILEAATYDVDIIEDDERLVDPVYCPYNERVKVIGELNEKGYNSNFSVNVTGNYDLLEEKVKLAIENGIRIFKLDVMVAGFDFLVKLRGILDNYPDIKTAITVFPDVYSKAYRNINRELILKLSRLCGADIIYAGSSILSRMGEIDNLTEELESDFPKLLGIHKRLSETISSNIKTTLPTLTHDINPKNVEILIHGMRIHNHYDYAFFIGGGISGFPCDLRIGESCEYWMNLVKHASNAKITGIRTFKDFNKIDFYPGTKKYYEGLNKIEEYLRKKKKK